MGRGAPTHIGALPTRPAGAPRNRHHRRLREALDDLPGLAERDPRRNEARVSRLQTPSSAVSRVLLSGEKASAFRSGYRWSSLPAATSEWVSRDPLAATRSPRGEGAPLTSEAPAFTSITTTPVLTSPGGEITIGAGLGCVMPGAAMVEASEGRLGVLDEEGEIDAQIGCSDSFQVRTGRATRCADPARSRRRCRKWLPGVNAST